MGGVNFGNTIEPDFRRFQTVRDIKAPDTSAYYLVVPSSASLESLGRFYSELQEESFSGAVNLVQQLKINQGKWIPKLKAGLFYERKERQFAARWMSYKKADIDNFNTALLAMPINVALSQDNINTTTGFKLEEGTNPFDSYDNFSEIRAAYVGLSLPITKKLSLTGGLRFEKGA